MAGVFSVDADAIRVIEYGCSQLSERVWRDTLSILGIVEQVFRDRASFFSGVQKADGLLPKIRNAAILWAAAFLISGVVIGVPGGVYQMLASAIKLPLLFGIAALATLPLLHLFALYTGIRLTIYQTAALASGMLLIVSLLMLALSPALLALWISVGHYGLYKLACGAALALSSVLGILFLKQGLDKLARGSSRTREFLFWVWAVLYSLVGGQLAWIMRPFVGSPNEPFQFFRGAGGSLYLEIARTFWSLILSLF